MNEWMALAVIDGWGEEDERAKYWACYTISSLHNSILIAASKQGADVKASDMLSITQLLNPPRAKSTKATRQQQHAATAAMLKRMCGF